MRRFLVLAAASMMAGLALWAPEVFAQSPASVTWNLTSDANVSSTAGNVTGQTQELSNLAVQNYTTNSAQRTSPDGAGTWPADGGEVSSRYMQFRVSPNGTNDFLVTSISLYLWVNSGSNMRANVYYSTDPAFATRTQIGSTFTLGTSAPGSPNVSAAPGVTVPSGGTIYLRVYPWYTTSTTSKHVLTKTVTISGSTTATGAAITTSQTSLTGFSQIVGTPSAAQTYTVSGSGLTHDVVVTPPAGFEISTDGGSSWHGNGSPITILQSGGTLTGQPVTIAARLNGPGASVYSGDITHTSTDATTKNVAVSGTTLATEPTVQSSITFGTVTGTAIDVNFSDGNGARRILVARSLAAVTWAPVDGSPVAGVSSDFSSATDQGSGNRAVYDGSGSSLTVTNLTPSTTYYFAVYEYNTGTGNTQNYDISSPGTGNQTTVATAALTVLPGSLTFGGVTINTVSPEQSYALSGNLLLPSSGNITVTPPAGYQVSATSGSGFGPTLTVPYTGGTLGSTTIFVRFSPIAVQSYTGSIANAGGGASTQNVSVSGSGTAPSVPNEFQAEDGILTSAYIGTQYTGYTGSGYVDIANKTGASLQILFRRATAASDTVRVYYALGGSSRAYAVSLNGSSVGSLSFTGTGSWTSWSSVFMVIPLQAGVNRLAFTATTNTSDNANVDRIVIGGQTATPVYKLTLAQSGAGTVAASPSSADSLYDAGTDVTLTASPSAGSSFYRWGGTDPAVTNPLHLTMNSHKTEIGTMIPSAGFGALPYETSPKGFASVGAFGYPDGTTGGSGAGARIEFVTNSTDLMNLMFRRVDASHGLNFPPLTVYVIGTLTADAGVAPMLDVKDLYDVSIIGVGTDATLTGFGLAIIRSKNVVVRNLKIMNSPDDGISVQADDVEGTGDHIWIDHCTITNCYDGALDITHTSSYVTVSWNRFYNHDKTCLMGHSDGQTSDVAMKVTYHHNFFDSTVQRHPRVRFGKAHVYNNYYRKNGIYGVSSNLGADVVVEGSYFLDVPIPTETSRDQSPPGDLVERHNIFAGTTGPPGTRGTAFDPAAYYAYSLDSASAIPQLLTAYAGSGKYDYSAGGTSTPAYVLAVTAAHGSVTRSPDQASYDSGATVQLTAVPNGGYHFVNWSGDASGSVNPTSIVMNGNRNVTANFAVNQYTILATAGANGSITPPGPVTVNEGASQAFTITPVPGYHVGDVLVDAGSVGAVTAYTFTNVTAGHTIDASFAQNPAGQYTLVVNATNGSVIKSPDQQFYPAGTVVHLTGVPAAGYHFASWSDSLTGVSNPDSITMNIDKVVTANFALNTYTLTVNTVGSGSVGKNPDLPNYTHGSSVILTATPQAGWIFSGWSGDTSTTSNPLSLVMTRVKSVTATFIVNPGAILSNGTGGGLWSSGSTWLGGIVPGDPDSVVIVGSDSVTLSVGDSCRSLSVSSGGKIALLDTLRAGRVNVAGTMVNYNSLTASGAVTFWSGSLYEHARNGGTIPRAIWNTGSTCLLSGLTANAPNNGRQNFFNMIWNCPGQTASLNMDWDSMTVGGNVTVLNTGTGRWQMAGPVAGDSSIFTIIGDIIQTGGNFTSNGTGNGNTKIVVHQHGNIVVTGGNFSVSRGSQGGTGTTTWYLEGGNFSMTNATTQNSNPSGAKFVFDRAGTQVLTLDSATAILSALPIEVASGTTLDMGASQLRGSGIFTLNSGATLATACRGGLDSAVRITGTKLLSAGANYIFNGSLAQSTGKSLPTAVNNLSLGNAAGLVLDTSTTVNGVLTLAGGKITTGTNILAVGPAGSVIRTSGHIAGYLRKTIAAGSGVARTFEIGDALNYAPVGVTFGNVTTPGTLLASTTGADHPQIATSGIDAAKSVNRYYTLTNSGTGFDNCAAVFNYAASDIDLTANTGSFVVRKYDGSVWSSLTVGTRTGTSTQAVGITSFSDFAVGDPVADTVTTPVSAGWNMLSVPLIPANPRTSVLFPTAGSPAFAYQGSYQVRDTLRHGAGYWIKFPASLQNRISGAAIELDTIGVRAGWNFIGSVCRPFAAAAITQLPSGIVASHLFGYAAGYFVTDTLAPGKGYWVKTNADGNLLLGTAGPVAAGMTSLNSGLLKTRPLNELSFSPVAAGAPDKSSERSIFFGAGVWDSEGEGELQRDLFDLPPVPPAGAFDARFATQRSAELFNPAGLSRAELPVLLQSTGDLMVSWRINQRSIVKYTLVERIAGSIVRKHPLLTTGSAMLRPGDGELFALVAECIPATYALMQNYPNPFNPSTVIGFDLPVKSVLSLRVFNLLGQEVAAPIDNRVMDAGREEIRFDGSGLGSGTYFYRISAISTTDASRSFVQVRKMLLIK